jgi:hypothetical protein
LHADPNLAAYLQKRAAEKTVAQKGVHIRFFFYCRFLLFGGLHCSNAAVSCVVATKPLNEAPEPPRRWGWLAYLSLFSVVGLCAGYYYRHDLAGLMKRYDINLDFLKSIDLSNWRSHLPLALTPYFSTGPNLAHE